MPQAWTCEGREEEEEEEVEKKKNKRKKRTRKMLSLSSYLLRARALFPLCGTLSRQLRPTSSYRRAGRSRPWLLRGKTRHRFRLSHRFFQRQWPSRATEMVFFSSSSLFLPNALFSFPLYSQNQQRKLLHLSRPPSFRFTYHARLPPRAALRGQLARCFVFFLGQQARDHLQGRDDLFVAVDPRRRPRRRPLVVAALRLARAPLGFRRRPRRLRDGHRCR